MSFRCRAHALALSALLLAGCGGQPVGGPALARSAGASSPEAKSILAKTVSVDWLVNMLMTDHDANKNGVLDISPTGIFSKKVNEAKLRAVGGSDYLGWQYKAKLYADADADKDQKVTRAEIEAKVRSYDADGDGKLHARGAIGALKKEQLGELDKFDKDYHVNVIVALFTQL